MNYKFELTEQEAQMILNALVELPYRISSPIIAKIQSQAEVQQKLENKVAEQPKPKTSKQ